MKYLVCWGSAEQSDCPSCCHNVVKWLCSLEVQELLSWTSGTSAACMYFLLYRVTQWPSFFHLSIFKVVVQVCLIYCSFPSEELMCMNQNSNGNVHYCSLQFMGQVFFHLSPVTLNIFFMVLKHYREVCVVSCGSLSKYSFYWSNWHPPKGSVSGWLDRFCQFWCPALILWTLLQGNLCLVVTRHTQK